MIVQSFEPDNAPTSGSNTISLASAVAIQSDGKIIGAGDSLLRNPIAPDYVLESKPGVAKYHPDGDLDETFRVVGRSP